MLKYHISLKIKPACELYFCNFYERHGGCAAGLEVAIMGKEAATFFAIYKVIVKNCQILANFACLCAAARVEVEVA